MTNKKTNYIENMHKLIGTKIWKFVDGIERLF